MLDKSDEFETHQYSFGGLADVAREFSTQLSGALRIPLTRLFGVSPGGLNSTGDSDIANYYDEVKQKQEDDLRTDVGLVLNILHRSVLGREPTSDLDFEFNSLWQINQAMKADIAQKNTTTILQAAEAGVVDHATALMELKQQSTITDVWTNITNEMIDKAKLEPPIPMGGLPEMPKPGELGPDGKPVEAAQSGAQSAHTPSVASLATNKLGSEALKLDTPKMPHVEQAPSNISHLSKVTGLK